MLRQSRRISWICTAGEMGALLLEARLIKEQQPLFNKRLRRNRQLCSLQLSEQKIEVVSAAASIFPMSQTCLASSPTVGRRCKDYRTSPMNKNCVTACWGLNR
ncbi:Excinuclease cho (excinuclease ABC alternativeC subunit) [Salmonella enterica subsp. arizonae]|uniref:Excinuclease cho n=1 Tax=Salmonella enterica subsp. arizonae TaxID=59203 RepID=A0A3S4G2S9_SALER|nr:Excinuclease cho (excinuclease ABC alternativeC subunit) [Salmonella enterica subsp. arizonae]